MSLINEALKKAQRQRSDQPTGGIGGADTGGHSVENGGRPWRAQSLVVLAGAATVLVVLSVLTTVYLVRHRPPQLTSPAPVVVQPVIRAESSEASPVIVAPPVISLAVTPTPSAERPSKPSNHAVEPNRPRVPAAAQLAVTPSDAPAESAAPIRSPERLASALAPLGAPVSAVAPFDARVITFVDAIRVTGIRSSGNESKVLMNDRVYRVNDIVDRSLALKLIKVESDMLTFTDANGVVYTKNF